MACSGGFLLRVFAENIARALEVINFQKLLFICAAISLKSFDDVLNGGVVDASVVRNPHLVFSKNFVHVNVVYSFTVANLFVKAVLWLGVFRRFILRNLLMFDISDDCFNFTLMS